ncbi:putative transport protein [Encephalitozoon cuniculi]|nr:putative transport protein [Encephalitozoon cuniculi]
MMKPKKLAVITSALFVVVFVTGYLLYNFYYIFMDDKTANAAFDKSKLRGKFSDSGDVIEGSVFFSFLYRFLSTLDEGVVCDSCVEGVCIKDSVSGKEVHLRNGLDAATRTLFKNRNVEKDLEEILNLNILDIAISMKEDRTQKADDENKNEELKDKNKSDIATAVSHAFIYILLKERLDLSEYKSYLDKVKDESNEYTREHLRRIGMKENISIFEGESDECVNIYDYLRIVMFATSKLIPEDSATTTN